MRSLSTLMSLRCIEAVGRGGTETEETMARVGIVARLRAEISRREYVAYLEGGSASRFNSTETLPLQKSICSLNPGDAAYLSRVGLSTCTDGFLLNLVDDCNPSNVCTPSDDQLLVGSIPIIWFEEEILGRELILQSQYNESASLLLQRQEWNQRFEICLLHRERIEFEISWQWSRRTCFLYHKQRKSFTEILYIAHEHYGFTLLKQNVVGGLLLKYDYLSDSVPPLKKKYSKKGSVFSNKKDNEKMAHQSTIINSQPDPECNLENKHLHVIKDFQNDNSSVEVHDGESTCDFILYHTPQFGSPVRSEFRNNEQDSYMLNNDQKGPLNKKVSFGTGVNQIERKTSDANYHQQQLTKALQLADVELVESMKTNVPLIRESNNIQPPLEELTTDNRNIDKMNETNNHSSDSELSNESSSPTFRRPSFKASKFLNNIYNNNEYNSTQSTDKSSSSSSDTQILNMICQPSTVNTNPMSFNSETRQQVTVALSGAENDIEREFQNFQKCKKIENKISWIQLSEAGVRFSIQKLREDHCRKLSDIIWKKTQSHEQLLELPEIESRGRYQINRQQWKTIKTVINLHQLTIQQLCIIKSLYLEHDETTSRMVLWYNFISLFDSQFAILHRSTVCSNYIETVVFKKAIREHRRYLEEAKMTLLDIESTLWSETTHRTKLGNSEVWERDKLGRSERDCKRKTRAAVLARRDFENFCITETLRRAEAAVERECVRIEDRLEYCRRSKISAKEKAEKRIRTREFIEKLQRTERKRQLRYLTKNISKSRVRVPSPPARPTVGFASWRLNESDWEVDVMFRIGMSTLQFGRNRTGSKTSQSLRRSKSAPEWRKDFIFSDYFLNEIQTPEYQNRNHILREEQQQNINNRTTLVDLLWSISAEQRQNIFIAGEPRRQSLRQQEWSRRGNILHEATSAFSIMSEQYSHLTSVVAKDAAARYLKSQQQTNSSPTDVKVHIKKSITDIRLAKLIPNKKVKISSKPKHIYPLKTTDVEVLWNKLAEIRTTEYHKRRIKRIYVQISSEEEADRKRLLKLFETERETLRQVFSKTTCLVWKTISKCLKPILNPLPRRHPVLCPPLELLKSKETVTRICIEKDYCKLSDALTIIQQRPQRKGKIKKKTHIDVNSAMRESSVILMSYERQFRLKEVTRNRCVCVIQFWWRNYLIKKFQKIPLSHKKFIIDEKHRRGIIVGQEQHTWSLRILSSFKKEKPTIATLESYNQFRLYGGELIRREAVLMGRIAGIKYLQKHHERRLFFINNAITQQKYIRRYLAKSFCKRLKPIVRLWNKSRDEYFTEREVIAKLETAERSRISWMRIISFRDRNAVTIQSRYRMHLAKRKILKLREAYLCKRVEQLLNAYKSTEKFLF